MANIETRIMREKETMEVMVRMHCGACHSPDGDLCPRCRELVDYAKERIDRCPHRDDKVACNKCQTHCYKPDMRERMREAMRYSGPRMMTSHPIMAIRHLMS